MVISYSIWKYLLGLGIACLLFGVWRIASSESEAAEANGIMFLLIGGPLIIAALLLALIAKSRS